MLTSNQINLISCILLCITLKSCSVVAEADGVLALPFGETIHGRVKAHESQYFSTWIRRGKHGNTNYLHYAVAANAADVCIYVQRGKLPTTKKFIVKNCTTTNLMDASVSLSTNLYRNHLYYVLIQTTSSYSDYAITVFNTTNAVNLHECPNRKPTNSHIVEGPYKWKGLCWYLSAAGSSCDQACESNGGDNLIDFALQAFDKTTPCPMDCPNEPVMWFAENKNHYNWTAGSQGVTSFRTLGYGYTDSYLSCHCGAINDLKGSGSLPNDNNNRNNRALVCSCFKA